MLEKKENHKQLVNLSNYKNKTVYYDLRLNKLYFSLPKGSSKNQHFYTLFLILIALPIVRLFNNMDIFGVFVIKYLGLILFTLISIFLGNFFVKYQYRNLDLYPASFSDIEYLEYLHYEKKNLMFVFGYFIAIIFSLVISFVIYLIIGNFLSLIIYSVLLFVIYVCFANRLYMRKRVVDNLLKEIST